MTQFLRAYALDDIKIRSGGTGRTVEAYATVFNSPAEVQDQDGHYVEQVAPGAFTRSLSQRSRFPVFYNHGMSLFGTPDSRGGVPIGSGEARVDGRGLLTVSEYNRGALADEILEAIRNGDITAQSFSGRFLNSSPRAPKGGFRARSDGTLTTVTRTEIALREWGPTPIPVYADAQIMGVRALASLFGGQMLKLTPAPTGTTPLADSDPDSATVDETPGALTEDSPVGTSTRSQSLRDRIHAARVARGLE